MERGETFPYCVNGSFPSATALQSKPDPTPFPVPGGSWVLESARCSAGLTAGEAAHRMLRAPLDAPCAELPWTAWQGGAEGSALTPQRASAGPGLKGFKLKEKTTYESTPELPAVTDGLTELCLPRRGGSA